MHSLVVLVSGFLSSILAPSFTCLKTVTLRMLHICLLYAAGLANNIWVTLKAVHHLYILKELQLLTSNYTSS